MLLGFSQVSPSFIFQPVRCYLSIYNHHSEFLIKQNTVSIASVVRYNHYITNPQQTVMPNEANIHQNAENYLIFPLNILYNLYQFLLIRYANRDHSTLIFKKKRRDN